MLRLCKNHLVIHSAELIVNKASGTFDVKINPLTAYNTSAEAKVARMSIDKEFHGELEATAREKC